MDHRSHLCFDSHQRQCAIWDVEAKQCHALFTVTEGCKFSQMLASPLAHQGVGSSSCRTLTNFGPEGSTPEKGTSFARRMPVIHTGALVPAGLRNSIGSCSPCFPPAHPFPPYPLTVGFHSRGTDMSLTNADHPASTRQDHTPKMSPDLLKWFWSLSAPLSICHRAPADSSAPGSPKP